MGVLIAPFEAQQESAWARAARKIGRRGVFFAALCAATVLAIAIAGYHPFAEDGGIYAVSVKQLLDPTLYPHDAAFAVEPSRWSFFAPAVAGLVRITHLPLPWALLVLHVASVWATLFATWILASRCFAQTCARAGALLLMACWLGLPVAGTALYVMDPYLTARSFATPAMLLAICGALDATGYVSDEGRRQRRRGWTIWAVALTVCAVMHPLTAMYAAIAAMLLACLQTQQRAMTWKMASLYAGVIGAVASAQSFAPTESAESVRAALSRSYWFLSEWQWYEVAGLIAPLAILYRSAWLTHRGSAQTQGDGTRTWRTLALAVAVAGTMACIVAVLFARENAAKHLIARLQPLRIFQIVYITMIILLGGWLGEYALKKKLWLWIAATAALGGIMFASARAEYPASSHLELPWITSKNPWAQAFDWVHDNTPRDALFALDADYIHTSGEDAQGFRAIAQRSVLPDFSKDGGEASIAHDLAVAWSQGVAAQTGLNAVSDAERSARLKPVGVTWIVLGASAQTRFDCPFSNVAVRICHLP